MRPKYMMPSAFVPVAERPLRSLRAARGVAPVADAAALAALGAWTADHSKDFESNAQLHDADNDAAARVLEIVRGFIAERGHIIFGGLAIDYALRLRGSRIYPDTTRPDFDTFSPRNVDDAYDLAELLRAAGFASVGAIRGIHTQTMRVRADYIWAADFGYAPPEVFNTIPTIDYRGLKIVHPDFQRMDMHLAFCFPFSGAPHEDVFHRWAKDLRRFNLLDSHYPLLVPPSAAFAPAAPVRARGRFAVPLVAANGAGLQAAVHGFAAYAILRAAYDELAAKWNGPDVAAPRLALEFPDECSISVESPAPADVIVASPWPERVLPGGARSDPYMDVYPESWRVPGAQVLSTRARQLAVCLVRAPGGEQREQREQRQLLVVSPQFLLLWFLFRAHQDKSPTYREFYNHTLAILRAAETLFADNGGDAALFAASPFAPVLSTLGDLNHDPAYVIRMATNALKLREKPPPALQLGDITGLLDGLPQNYYPDGKKARPVFDYAACRQFRRAGELSKPDGPP
jgi:hypothetical protein